MALIKKYGLLVGYYWSLTYLSTALGYLLCFAKKEVVKSLYVSLAHVLAFERFHSNFNKL